MGQNSTSDRPIAAIYRGPIASEGCAESLAILLRKSPARFKVHYLGPNETHDVNDVTLGHLDLFAWPGGGDDQASDFKHIKHYAAPIRKFVQNGGLYAGFCLGAFFARGQNDGEDFFGLLPPGSYVSSERFEPHAEVKGDEDTIVKTDWTWSAEGRKKGRVDKGKWQYFQDGGQIHLGSDIVRQAKMLGRYSATQNPCATITPYGSGQVGLIGVHPEADKSWYEDWNGSNPDGINYELGWDFVMTLWEIKKKGVNDWMKGT